MSQPRQRIFGPLFYSTLFLAVVVLVVSGAVSIRPWVLQQGQRDNFLVDLQGPDPARREVAAQGLSSQGEDIARPVFVKLTSDPRVELRALAYRHLGVMIQKPGLIVPMLLPAAMDPEVLIRVEATRGLGIMAPVLNPTDPLVLAQSGLDPSVRAKSLSVLNQRLADPESMVRAEAVVALGQYGGSPEFLEKLNALLDDKDRRVRMLAARTLMSVLRDPEEPRAIGTLLTLLSDPEPIGDRSEVLHTLMGSSDAVQNQAAAALARLFGEVEDAVRPDILECLVTMGPRASVALPLFEKSWAKEEDPTIRAQVGQMIARLDGSLKPRSIEILSTLVTDPLFPEAARLEAMEVLNPAGPAVLAKLSSRLVEQLAHPSSEVRRVAAALLQTVVAQVPAELPDPKPQK